MRFLQLLVRSLTLLVCAFLSASGRAQRLVFAHYMVTNQDYVGDNGHNDEAKIAGYQREIREAQALGIDGFALNVGGWLRETYYLRYTAQLFEAALRLHSGFKLFFSADMCCGNTPADVEDMMRRFAGNPRYAEIYLRRDKEAVLTTFAGDKLGPAAWQQIRDDLLTGAHPSTTAQPTALPAVAGPPSNAALPTFFVPAFFWGGELPKPADVQAGLEPWHATLDGAFYWGIAGVPGSGGGLDQLPSSRAYAAALHAAGKLYLAPVCLQFWGANADRYFEYSGGQGFGRMWQDAIQTTHPEWVEIITWNDFIEGTYVSPLDDPNRYPQANFLNGTGVPGGTLGYFHSHAAVGSLLAFYISWYKTGQQPAITRDALNLFYRTQPSGFDAGKPSVAHKYGPVADQIYVTLRLTRPAVLEVVSGARTTRLPVRAGLSEVSAPFVAGTVPQLRLRRGGKVVLSLDGTERIETAPRFNDFYYATGSR